MKKKKVLVIGSGGREHALIWKLSKSLQIEKKYCIPGNGGIEQLAECYPLNIFDFSALIKFVKEKEIDLTFVGPEAPLVAGIVDAFQKEGLVVCGPNKTAAQLEGSKIFAKNFMKTYNIPTAEFEFFDEIGPAIDYIDNLAKKQSIFSAVVKADGLAAGKGVVVCDNPEEAKTTVQQMLGEKYFGDAGKKVIIEEKLAGEEATVLALCDGETIVPLASSQDHKRIFDNDSGPNTGGMGAYAPASVVDKKLWREIETKIFANFLTGLKTEKLDYCGIIYFGLMLTEVGPKVLEFNCRFGDPETQAVIPLVNEDLIDLIEMTTSKKLSQLKLGESNHSAACVVLTSGGYPGDYEKGKEITGLEDAYKMENVIVFHSGTRKINDKIVTSGGRVLGVTGIGQDLKNALNNAYSAVEKIKFDGMHYRKDIGIKELKRNYE